MVRSRGGGGSKGKKYGGNLQRNSKQYVNCPIDARTYQAILLWMATCPLDILGAFDQPPKYLVLREASRPDIEGFHMNKYVNCPIDARTYQAILLWMATLLLSLDMSPKYLVLR